MGNRNAKSQTTRKFLHTKFPNKITDSYDIRQTCRQSTCSLSKRVTEKSTGDVYMAEYLNKVTSRRELADLARTHKVFKAVNHPNFLKLQEVFRLSKERYVFVTSNYHDTDLFDVISKKTRNSEIPEEEVARYTYQLLQVVQHLHSLNMVHRDIKPEWVYFEDTECTKILLHPGPFCTEPGNATDLTQTCGTLTYLAPEIGNRQKYGKEVDCWSLGVTVFVMLSGTMPYISTSEPEILELVKKGEYLFDPEYWGERSDEAKDFVKGLMNVDAKERMNCSQALKHSWITKNSTPEN